MMRNSSKMSETENARPLFHLKEKGCFLWRHNKWFWRQSQNRNWRWAVDDPASIPRQSNQEELTINSDNDETPPPPAPAPSPPVRTKYLPLSQPEMKFRRYNWKTSLSRKNDVSEWMNEWMSSAELVAWPMHRRTDGQTPRASKNGVRKNHWF